MAVVVGRQEGDGYSLARSSVWFPWPHHPVHHCAPGSAVWAASTAFSKPVLSLPRPALCRHHPLSHGSWSGGQKFGDYYGQTWVLTSKLSHLSGL